MAHPSVIALIGQAGAGKSTVIRHLVMNHSYKELKWSHDWIGIAAESLARGDKLVCDDIRFLSGQDKSESYLNIFKDSKIWRIRRKGLPTKMDHPSEKFDTLPFDRTISNYGSIGELKTAIDGMIVC